MTPVEVAAAVIEREGRIMICRRMAGDSGGGLWEFPGGKREPGETLAQCLIREIREELGCAVSVGELILSCPAEWKGQSLALHFFRADIVSGEPTPIEVERIEWVTPEEMGTYDFLPSNGPIVRRLMAPDR